MAANETRCGYVAIIGQPNVGKSTLLNRILGEKLSITSKKPQTTRHQILGVKTKNNVQTLYVDTPGMHQKEKKAVNRLMNKAVTSVIRDVDVLIFMIDARRWTQEDEYVLQRIQHIKSHIIIALNKVDLAKDKKRLLPIIEKLSKKLPNANIFPISATKDIQVDVLEKRISELLPKSPFLFPEDQLTDKDDRFFISEIVREKLMRISGSEVPYETAVVVESMQVKEKILHLDVVIWVEREGKKKIIIGQKGEKLKAIGTQARFDLEKKFKTKIFLTLWVKVKKGWSNNINQLSQLGMN